MKLIISCHDAIHVITQTEILYCKADDSYTTIFLSNGSKITISKSLSKFSERLSSDLFLKVNQSYIINGNCITKIWRRDKVIELTNLEKIRFTISLKSLFLALTKTGLSEDFEPIDV